MCRYAFHEYKSHFACFACRKAFKKVAIGDFMKQRGMDYVYERISARPAQRRPTLKQSSKYRKLMEELGETYSEIRDTYFKEVGTCPQCRTAMAPMGLDFRAPPLDDEEAWKVIEVLHEHGFAFFGCGCDVGYVPPSKLSGLPAFLSKHARKSDGEKLLAAIAARTT